MTLVCMFKCLKYHSLASKSGTQIENLAKSNKFSAHLSQMKGWPTQRVGSGHCFLQNIPDIIFTPSRVD
jgi:hypothetical protein